MRRRAHQIAAWLRRRSGEAKDEVLDLTGELATIAEASIKEAQVVAQNARRALRRAGEGASGKATALVAELERTISVLEAVVAQTRTRLGGEVPDGSTRIVSLHDTDARPIAKGRLGRPSSSASRPRSPTTPTASCSTTPSRWATRPTHRCSGPPSAASKRGSPRCPEPSPRIAAMERPRWRPNSTSSACNTSPSRARDAPVSDVKAVESSRRFRKLVKWRTGSEGRISYLKHSWGWERTMIDGIDGARTWCGWGVLAHNATKIAVLIDEREQTQAALLRRRNDRGPRPDHRDGPRHRRPLSPPDLAPTLSRRAPPPETAGKWGQKRPERSGRELMGARGGHSGQLGNRTGSTFSGRSS